MMGEQNATRTATVSFARYNRGTYEGRWVARGRRGEVRPRLGASPNHGGVPWTVRVVDRETGDGQVKDVHVEVPWRLSSESLTAEEIARILELARAEVGEYTVID